MNFSDESLIFGHLKAFKIITELIHMPMVTFLKKRIQSFVFAGQGLSHLFKTQPNAQIHLSLAVLATCLGVFFGLNPLEWCLICLCIGLVIAAESFNTALESLVDLASPEYHLLAKITKDTASAAVLILALTALIIGGIIFLPKILTYMA